VSYYLDTSAAVKLVKRELESDALVAFLSGAHPNPLLGEPVVAGDVLRTELVAAVLRAGDAPPAPRWRSSTVSTWCASRDLCVKQPAVWRENLVFGASMLFTLP